MPGRVNYVFVGKDGLRHFENELSDGVSEKLPGWSEDRSIIKAKKGSVNVTFFIYRRAHVMMSHGLADKNYLLRKNPLGGREINKFRVVCVPGPWMKRKLLAARGVKLVPEAIQIVGWPRIDKLVAAAAGRETRESKKIRVLWAPTHFSGGVERAVSSYPPFMEYEGRMSELFDYSVSLHPSVRGGGKPTFESLLDADVVIGDRGTLVYEAWALGKPVVFPSWLIGEGNRIYSKGSAENYIYRERIGLHAGDFDEMVDMIRGAKAPDDRVTAFMQDYLPVETRGKSYELIAKAVRDVWDSGNLRLRKRVKAASPKTAVDLPAGDKIEVTPAMIEAAGTILTGEGLPADAVPADVLARIYRAMEAAGRGGRATR